MYSVFIIILGGSIIISVHLVRVMSLSPSRPQLTVPSSTPFWTSSSFSNSWKLWRTFTPEPMVVASLRGSWITYSWWLRNIELFLLGLGSMPSASLEVKTINLMVLNTLQWFSSIWAGSSGHSLQQGCNLQMDQFFYISPTFFHCHIKMWSYGKNATFKVKNLSLNPSSQVHGLR